MSEDEGRTMEEPIYPSRNDGVEDIPLTAEGTPNIREGRKILEWDDGYGNTFYTVHPLTRRDFSGDEVKSLLAQMRTEQTSFNSLDPEEQSRIRTEFGSSNGTAEGVRPYTSFLQSETLRGRFEQLKPTIPHLPLTFWDQVIEVISHLNF